MLIIYLRGNKAFDIMFKIILSIGIAGGAIVLIYEALDYAGVIDKMKSKMGKGRMWKRNFKSFFKKNHFH